MKQEKKDRRTADYTPIQVTFPLADSMITEDQSNNSIPSEDDVVEVKNWVDFKEM